MTVAAGLLASLALLLTYSLLGRGVPAGRRLLYGALRACALGAVLAAIAQPERSHETSLARRRRLAVLLDGSASMRLPASRTSRASRHDLLRELLARHRPEFEELGRRYDLAVYSFGDDAEPAPSDPLPIEAPAPDSPATALGEALVRALDDSRGRALAGIVVLSDGASNLGLSLDAAAGELAGVPVYAIGLGEPGPLPDARVSALEAPAEATVGRPFGIAVRVESWLEREAAATLVLRAAGREVERRTLVLPAGNSAREVRSSVTPAAGGTVIIEAELLGLETDVAPWNDRRLAFVDVAERRLRLLYVEGVLRRDYRAIKRALGAFGGGELDVARAFVRGRGSDEVFQGVRLAEYDAFVLGELPDDALPEPVRETLRRLVCEGGKGLLVFAGPRALAGSFVESLLPARIVEPGPAPAAAARPAPAARSHPALRGVETGATGPARWSALAPLGDRPAKVELRGAADVLLEAGGVPVLVAGRTGAGRSAALLSGESFVWAEDPAAPRELYARLARNLAAWVAGVDAPREALSVSLSRHALWRGDTVSILARVNRTRARELGLTDGEIDSLRLVARAEPARSADAPRAPRVGPSASGGTGTASPPPAGESVRLERAGLEHTGSLRAAGSGIWRLVVESEFRDSRLEPASTMFVVEEDSREFERLEADPAALERLARATHGLYAPSAEAGRLLRGLAARPPEPPLTVRRRTSLWDWWGALAAFLGCLSAEWWMRRR